jgi:hypothetical protein
VATNRLIVHPLGIIYEHGDSWWNDINRRKLLIHSPELLVILPAESSSSKQKEWAKEITNLYIMQALEGRGAAAPTCS